MLKCEWCETEQASMSTKDCQWIEPGGIHYVVVTDIPAIDCPVCNDIYLDDEMNEQIEEALNTVELSSLGSRFSYEQLMKAPRVSIFQLFKQANQSKC
jgi:uncharacterized YokU family protein